MTASPSSLAGKTALVTGASRGIGRAIAIALGRAGATVCVHYATGETAARETASAIEVAGGKAFCLSADLGVPDGPAALAAAFGEAQRASGGAGLDVLVNNAGIGTMATIGETDAALYDRQFALNVRAPFFLTQALLGQLNDGGRVINISSMVSVAAYAGCMSYAMTKASVNSFTRSLAAELGPRGITVNGIAPGATDTDFIGALKENAPFMDALTGMTALGRLGRPDDIAAVALFLASDAGGWVTGQLIQASGGMHL